MFLLVFVAHLNGSSVKERKNLDVARATGAQRFCWESPLRWAIVLLPSSSSVLKDAAHKGMKTILKKYS